MKPGAARCLDPLLPLRSFSIQNAGSSVWMTPRNSPPSAAWSWPERIREHALAWAVAEVDAQRIDAWNIYQASRQAMTAAGVQSIGYPNPITCSLTPCNSILLDGAESR